MLKIDTYKIDNRDVPKNVFKITDLKTNESFEIYYMDNLDLYWSLNSNKKIVTFEIERNDLILFCVFKELFNNLRTNKLFKHDKNLFNDEDLNHINNRIKPLLYNDETKTINYKSFELKDWTCRDGKRDYFEIVENLNGYTLTFYDEGKEEYTECSIRMNTNRNEYESLIILFTNFYETLQDYYECYQISFDDYVEVIKKIRSKK